MILWRIRCGAKGQGEILFYEANRPEDAWMIAQREGNDPYLIEEVKR